LETLGYEPYRVRVSAYAIAIHTSNSFGITWTKTIKTRTAVDFAAVLVIAIDAFFVKHYIIFWADTSIIFTNQIVTTIALASAKVIEFTTPKACSSIIQDILK